MIPSRTCKGERQTGWCHARDEVVSLFSDVLSVPHLSDFCIARRSWYILFVFLVGKYLGMNPAPRHV